MRTYSSSFNRLRALTLILWVAGSVLAAPKAHADLMPTSISPIATSATPEAHVPLQAYLYGPNGPLSQKYVCFYVYDQLGHAGVVAGSTDQNGLATANFWVHGEDYPEGTYDVAAIFGGDGAYQACTEHTTLTVFRYDTSISPLAAYATPEAHVGLQANLYGPDGAPLRNEWVDFYVYDQLGHAGVVAGSTDQNGLATANFWVHGEDYPEGTYDVAAIFSGDSTYHPCTKHTTLTVFKELCYLQQALTGGCGPNLAHVGDQLVYTVTLCESGTGNPLEDRSISFNGAPGYIDPDIHISDGAFITDSNGVAFCVFTVPPGIRHRWISAWFDGDETYHSTFCAQEYIVEGKPTGSSLYKASGLPGTRVNLACVVVSGGKPATGATVKFSVEGSDAGQGTVDSSGNASVTYTIPATMSVGVHNVSAQVVQDDTYDSSTRTSPALTVKGAVSFSVYAASGSPGDTVALRTLVYSGGAPVAGVNVRFAVDGTVVGNATSESTGASIAYKIPASMPAGTHNVTVSVPSDPQYTGNPRTTPALTVLPPRGNISFSIYSAMGVPGDQVTLKTLVYSGGKPVAGLPIWFAVEGNQVGAVLSDASGASLPYKIPASLSTGTHNVTVSFNGSTAYNSASCTTAALTVGAPKAGVSFSIYKVSGAPGDRVTLKTLVYSGGKPVSGLPINFSVDDYAVGSAQSDASCASIPYAIPASMTPGTHNVTVSFAGNASHLPQVCTSPALTVNTPKSSLSFSIGPASGAIGDTVTLRTLVYSGGSPALGLPVHFAVSGDPTFDGVATSDASGASCAYKIPPLMIAGPRSVTVSFAGDATHYSATRTTPALTIKATGSGTVTGRWDWTSSTGASAGVFGALLTATGSGVTGSVAQFAISNGQFNSGVLTGSITDQKGELLDFTLTLSADSQALFGTSVLHSASGDVLMPQEFDRKSDDPINPDPTAPTILSISPANGATGVARTNLPIVTVWSKPVHGWDLTLVGNIGGIPQTLHADDVVDSSQNTYDATANTYTMYLRSDLTLDPLTTYTLRMDTTTAEGDYADWPDWRDPYGVPAWTDASGIANITFTTGP